VPPAACCLTPKELPVEMGPSTVLLRTRLQFLRERGECPGVANAREFFRIVSLEVPTIDKSSAGGIWKCPKTGISSPTIEAQSSRMPRSEEYPARYKYSLRLEAGGQISSESSEMTGKEIQDFVKSALGLMTAGCEQCVHSQRLFCEKRGRSVKVRDARCEYFSRRPSAAVPSL